MTTQADIDNALDKLALLVSSEAVCAEDIGPIWDVLENAAPVETCDDRIQARVKSLTKLTLPASP